KQDYPEMKIDWERGEWLILACRGCEGGSFRYTSLRSDELGADLLPRATTVIYPPRGEGRRVPRHFENLPARLRALYAETINSYNSHLLVLAAAGVRGLVEGICVQKRIKGGTVLRRRKGGTKATFVSTLDGKIAGLAEAQLLTARHAATLHEHRYLGNEALHELQPPRPEQIAAALDILEHTFDHLYELDAKRRVARGRKRRQ